MLLVGVKLIVSKMLNKSIRASTRMFFTMAIRFTKLMSNFQYIGPVMMRVTAVPGHIPDQYCTQSGPLAGAN